MLLILNWVSVQCSGSSSKVSSVYACLLSLNTYNYIAAGDIDEIMDEVISVAESWQKILILLHLPSLVKSTIAATNPTDPSACLRTVIVLWLQREYDVEQYGPPSWRALVEAVADPAGGNDTDLAESIAEKYPGMSHCTRCMKYSVIICFFYVCKTVQTITGLGSQLQSDDLSVRLRMSTKFARTVESVADHLNRSTVAEDLKRFLSAICDPLIPENMFIERTVYESKCTTKDVIYSLIPQYINYISFTLLEEIIDTFNNQEARVVLNDYIRDIRKCRLREVSPPTSDEEMDHFQGRKELKVTIDDEEENITVDNVHNVTRAVEQATGVPKYSPVFAASNASNSVLLIFLIPETVTDIFHHLCTEDLAILANAGITKIQLEDLEITNIRKYITNMNTVPEKRVELKPTSLEHYVNERTDLSSGQRSELNVMLKKVTESKLSEVCSEQLLQKFSQHIQNWKTLAPFLGMQDFYYDEFTAKYPEINQQNYQLLLSWKRREGNRAIYHHLLETVVLHGTAREMEALILIPLTGVVCVHTGMLIK